MARVCARRAAGFAIRWFLTTHPRPTWKPDALNQLIAVRDDELFPSEVRQCATRLTSKISDTFQYPFATDPLNDARTIIQWIENIMESHA